jgi:hypothetical protein
VIYQAALDRIIGYFLLLLGVFGFFFGRFDLSSSSLTECLGRLCVVVGFSFFSFW